MLPWLCAEVSQGEIFNHIYLLTPSSEDDSKAYKVAKLQRVTREQVVTALQRLNILGLIPKDQIFGAPDDLPQDEDDVPAVQLLSQIELHEGGEYIVIFAEMPLETQVCKRLAFARKCYMHVLNALLLLLGHVDLWIVMHHCSMP